MAETQSKSVDFTSWMIGFLFAISLSGFGIIANNSKVISSSSAVIMEKIPQNIYLVDPRTDRVLDKPEVRSRDFQVKYASSNSVVGWISFITDQGQPLSDKIAIGTSMASFTSGEPKTFPVVLQSPKLAKDFHLVMVLCEFLGVQNLRPKVQDIETFMRIGAMGGKLPRSDCSTLHFRI